MIDIRNGTNESRAVPVMADCQFGYRSKWKISRSGAKRRTVLKWVSLLEMGMPFPVLVNCAFGYLQRVLFGVKILTNN